MKVSVNIISKRFDNELHECIKSVIRNDFPKNRYEIVLVYEYDDESLRKSVEDELNNMGVNFNFKEIDKGNGISYNRNQCIMFSKTNYVLLVDSDCIVSENWIKNMYNSIENSPEDVAAVAGDIKTKDSNFMGECISLLGFPGGGSLGFKNVFAVDPDGYTNHISHGNSIVKKNCAEEINLFEEVVPIKNKKGLGQTDKYFAYKLRKQGYRLKYIDTAPVYHPPYDNIPRFLKRNFAKGVIGYWYIKKTNEFSKVKKARLNTIKYILRKSKSKLPFTVTLLGLSYLCEISGYMYSYIKDR